LGLWVAVALVAISTTDLAIRTAAPLADTALITADRALGFDWSVWTARIDAHPAARLFLAVVYVSILPQLLGSFVYFAFIGRVRRSRELAVITLVALIPTAAALLVAPALGPFVDFGMPDRAVYLASLQSLRAGALVHTVGPGDGMVCFPSFHTVWALALIYVHRGNGWITAVIATLNAVLIISVLSEGGHYLVDLLAGIVVAMAAISVTRWTMREPRRITA
jgi:membrane-associated phospholipid phosphatase